MFVVRIELVKVTLLRLCVLKLCLLIWMRLFALVLTHQKVLKVRLEWIWLVL